MNELNCVVKFGTDVSKKTGSIYKFLEITLENGYTKRIFLETPEIFMIEQLLSNKK